MTEIRAENPPNIATLRKAFGLTGNEIFAWDGVIYNPGGGGLTRALIEHEKVHFRQQREVGGPEVWWGRFIVDPAWRLEQELEATAVEFKVYSEDYGRPQRGRRHHDRAWQDRWPPHHATVCDDSQHDDNGCSL